MKVSLSNENYKFNKELIFSDYTGSPLKQSSYRTYFYKICKLANVPILSPHALRHSHAVHLLESGANIKYVSERLGHATINMTANVYLHISKKLNETPSLCMKNTSNIFVANLWQTHQPAHKKR